MLCPLCVCVMLPQALSLQRLTAVGFIRAVLAVDLAITALPVRDAVGGSATQELTPAATTRDGWGRRSLGGHWSQRHRAISCRVRENVTVGIHT